MAPWEMVGVVAGLVSAIATSVLGFIAYRLSRTSSRQIGLRTLGQLANTMVGIRLEYPEVLARARAWTPTDWDVVYGVATPGGDIASANRYYSYVETGLEFCNAVLEARADRTISPTQYTEHYAPLVRLFLTENWPIIESMLGQSFLSPLIRRHVAAVLAEGWNFAERHRDLVGGGNRPA